MGFLHKLWDETLAGPAPETGLGKLRKYDSFSATTSAAPTRSSPPHYNEEIAISRSITILRTNSNFKNLAVDPGSPVSSSAPSTPGSAPTTPFSPGTPRGDFRRFMRQKSSAEALQRSESTSPTIYDWIVISAWDR